MARLELIVDASQAAKGFRQAEEGSERYQRSARETIRRNQRLKDSFSRIRQNVFNLRNAMIGLAGAGAMGAVIQRSLASTAALSEQADVAGINVEKFQELTKAFSDMAGVQESVTSGALRRFNRRFGLAQEGMGAAVNTLERLNISLEQGTGPALDEAIEKLANMENGANRTAEASQLFGEDAGPRLAAALAQGGDALDETIQKLREQGRIMGGESVDAARDFNDRFNELKDTLSTKFARAIAQNAEELESLAEATIKLGEAAIDFGDEAIGFMQWLRREIDPFGFESDDLLQLEQRLKGVRAEIEALEGSPSHRGKDAALEALQARESTLERQVELMRSRAEIEAQFSSGMIQREIDAQLDFLGRSSRDRSGGGDDGGGRSTPSDRIGEIQFNDSTVLEITRELEGNLADLRAQADETSTSINRIGDIPFNRSSVMEITTELERNLERLGEQSQETSDEMSEFARSAARNMQSAFADFLFDPMEKGFDGLVRSFANTIQRMIAEAAAAEILDSVASSSGNGGGGLGSLLSGFIANSANGNVFTGPSMTTVSERGHPEAVLPLERQNGKLGVRASGGEGGGQTIVNVRNESGGQAEVSRRSSGRDQIVDILIPAVQSGIQSGRLDGPMRERFGITPGTRGR